MDHIDTPDQDLWPEEVPYLQDSSCTYIYDNGRWIDFPERMGWSVKTLRDIANMEPVILPEHTNERAASLVQAWLYFGIIHAITRILINMSDFLVQNASSRIRVNTRHLPRYLESWRCNISRYWNDMLCEYSKNLDGFLDVVSEIISMLAHLNKNLICPEVQFSIQVLWATLIAIKLNIFPNSAITKHLQYEECMQTLRNHLVGKKWCPSDINRLEQSVSSLTLYHMSASAARLSTRNHSRCEEKNCRGLQRVDKSFSPRHVYQGCLCDLIGIKKVKLVEMTDTGSWPVLKYSDRYGLEVYAVQVGTNDTPYVAISHVWANGLGNPNSNEMHHCQIARIQEQVNAIARN